MNIWVLSADNSRARIFETSRPKVLEKEITTLTNPAGRQSTQDLASDRPGRMVHPSSSEQRKTYDPPMDPRQYQAMQFAREIAQLLNKGALENRFDKLYILAPPSFLGMLRQELENQARKRIAAEIDKNVTRLKMEEIRDYLPEYL